ncbi:formylglycine-generating enzyme family protein [Candidatus Halobeggiatoa sp. HSG11]|nr:formylglycine-generating enzyme family protein [Candidatus Halobeggiatoa sp. HSG11]
MARVFIATFIASITVGGVLLWFEYNYFIPLYTLTTQAAISSAIKKNTPKSDKFFQDSLKIEGNGPEMVVIPAGHFQMGDIQNVGAKWEQPVHTVSIDSFAIGRYEVTFAEYDQFALATGRKLPKDEGWGRGKRPVINVAWQDIIAYIDWLSEQTGYKYRLPTEAEWEYAARATTNTIYWWGNEIGYNQSNCDGCGSRWDNKKTAKVGSFAPNYFGLYDTVGNVYEWTCSEYEILYNGKEQHCLKFNEKAMVIRGGSWYSLANYTRSAARFKSKNGDFTIGFRIARNYTKPTDNKTNIQIYPIKPRLYNYKRHQQK